MSQPVELTARVSLEVVAELDRLAVDLDRSREWVLTTAIERFVREERELIDFIKVGEADIAAGRVRSHEEVMTLLEVRKGNLRAA